MGVNVFYPKKPDEWLIGSFSGLFIWNPSTGSVLDYYTGHPPAATYGRPLGRSLVNGFTDDLITREVIFEYDNGARNKENNLALPAMPCFYATATHVIMEFLLRTPCRSLLFTSLRCFLGSIRFYLRTSANVDPHFGIHRV